MIKETKDKKPNKPDLLKELAQELPLFTDEDYVVKSEPISSGSISLDMAMGGGFPRGCIVDVFGVPSAGKSLISIMTAASVQRAGGKVVIWDCERSYSKNLNWLKTNGVDTSKLMFLKLKSDQGAEIGFDAVERIAKAGAADLIIIDSVPALIPQCALDKDMTESARVGARAALLTNALPRLAGIADEGKVLIMFISQMRANFDAGFYGPKEKETSIFALKHFSALRLSVKKVSKSTVLENDVPISHRVHVDIVKNKVAAPYRQAEFTINYEVGIDASSEVADILASSGLAKKGGAWYDYDGLRFNGMAKLTDHFRVKANLDKGIAAIKAAKINLYGVQKEVPVPGGTLSELAVESEDNES